MDLPFNNIAVPVLIALGASIFSLAARSIGFRVLHRWAKKTASTVDDIILDAFRMPSFFWAVAIGIYTGIAFSGLPERQVFYLSKIIYVLIVFSITIVAANLSVQLLRNYVRHSHLPFPTTGLAYGTLRGIILVIGFLVIFGILGISIAPVITALGIGGLAAALALQDTLANLFAGVNILIEQAVRVGDFVKLESGQEGYIEDITWRTTRVRMLANNMIVIPNNKLAQSIVTNYYLPDKRMSVLIPVGVSYAADPGSVENILTDVAKKAVGEIPGLLGEPEPAVKFIPGFGQSSLDFTLVCQIREFTDQFPVQHELRKRIWKRLQQEGIEIPFPTRTVHLKEEKEQPPRK